MKKSVIIGFLAFIAMNAFVAAQDKDAVVKLLDKGMQDHYASKFGTSFTSLEEAERLIAEFSVPSVTEGLAALVTNDNAKSYAGEVYEDLYASVFNALNNYHKGSIEDARVEARQINEKLAKLLSLAEAENKKVVSTAQSSIKGFSVPAKVAAGPVTFRNSALGQYVTLVLLRGYSDATPFIAQIDGAYKAAPTVYANPVPKSIADEKTIPAGKARLNVIGFAGQSPQKVEVTESVPLTGLAWITAYAAVLASSNPDALKVLGNLALTTFGESLNFAFPVLSNDSRYTGKSVKGPTEGADRIVVQIDGQGEFELELLENIGAVVTETFQAHQSAIAAKSYIRSIIKTATLIGGFAVAQIAADKESDPMKQVALKAALRTAQVAVSSGLKSTEKADIRCAHYLPNKAYVGGVTLDPGTYKVTTTFYKGSSAIGKSVQTVEVKANQPNIIEAVNLK